MHAMRLISLISIVILLQACQAPLTEEGQSVRQINADAISPCRFLGVVEGSESFAWTAAGDRRNALNKVRNQVASMGGDSYVLTQTNTSEFGTNTQADAYDCSNVSTKIGPSSCYERGLAYFRAIGSYPNLSDGRSATDVAYERCARSATAFPE